MRTVRVLFPTVWDRQQLQAARAAWERDYRVEFVPPDDADCRADFEILGFVDRSVADWRGTTDGVFSSSDYPGAAVAAAIGTGLGLSASAPAAILRSSHKGLARAVQSRCAPSATPPFAVLDPDANAADPGLPFPLFVKPAKGCYSVLARAVDSAAALRAFLRGGAVDEYRNGFLRLYRELGARYLGNGFDGREFVVEGLLQGRMFTVEAFATDRSVQALGVVDSVRHRETGSFVAFEYPSSLPAAVQQRACDLACRLGAAFELRWTLFNVELMWDEATDRLGIVELNPRICGQFADLYEKVDGEHGYRLALDLACGVAPTLRRTGGRHACAASFPLRIFEPARVVRVPRADDLAVVRAEHPDALVWSEVREGDVLSDFSTFEDGASCRYAVLNVGGSSRADVARQRDAIVARLGFRFAALGS